MGNYYDSGGIFRRIIDKPDDLTEKWMNSHVPQSGPKQAIGAVVVFQILASVGVGLLFLILLKSKWYWYLLFTVLELLLWLLSAILLSAIKKSVEWLCGAKKDAENAAKNAEDVAKEAQRKIRDFETKQTETEKQAKLADDQQPDPPKQQHALAQPEEFSYKGLQDLPAGDINSSVDIQRSFVTESVRYSLKSLQAWMESWRPWEKYWIEGINAETVYFAALTIAWGRDEIAKISDEKVDFCLTSGFNIMQCVTDKVKEYKDDPKKPLSIVFSSAKDLYQYLMQFDFNVQGVDQLYRIHLECWKKLAEIYGITDQSIDLKTKNNELLEKNATLNSSVERLHKEGSELRARIAELESSFVKMIQPSAYEDLQRQLGAVRQENEQMRRKATAAQSAVAPPPPKVPSTIKQSNSEPDNMQYYQPGYSMPEAAQYLSETSESAFESGSNMIFSITTRRVMNAPLWMVDATHVLPNPLLSNVLEKLSTEITLKRAFVISSLGSSRSIPKQIIPACIKREGDGFVLVNPGKVVY